MLFGYPVSAATTNNWLHECLCEILCSIHASLQTATPLPVWPEILPDRYRNRLKSRKKTLGNKLSSYYKTLKNLTPTEQERILQALHDQNEIALLLSCQLDCETIGDLPQTIHKPVKELFECAFELLTDLEIRDELYKIIYDATPHICPFCGCQPFDALGSRREALDHYLAESKYPLAGSNLRNLVPMCNKCNSGYKLAQDILIKKDGTRRKSFDPYNCTGIRLSLENSQPFAGKITPTGELPRWRIEFSPNTEEVITWDEVFHIRERYERDVLDAEFNTWLKDFKIWRESANIIPNSDKEWVDALNHYATLYERMGVSEKAFLKAAVFRMLHTHCEKGDERLINFIKNYIQI